MEIILYFIEMHRFPLFSVRGAVFKILERITAYWPQLSVKIEWDILLWPLSPFNLWFQLEITVSELVHAGKDSEPRFESIFLGDVEKRQVGTNE